MRKVVVESYNENWEKRFLEEKEQLESIFGDELVEIYHIGSTSVPELSAKPVIDMMPVARDISRIDRFNNDMEKLGYEPMGELGISGRRFFRKGGEERSHHVHVFEEDSHDIKRHVAFRDYLRTHKDEAKQYGDLKMKLAQQHPYDIEAYIKEKEELVLDIEQRALSWYREQ